ncbi:hypothetical protein HGM15179_019229 [Zosterops borbonicus]|uniref:Uncharacterized protein n=1 Tax=Zosterops borbonicus TaxID=364589 RepID=A0A8K1FYP9_9PASS|nr:hypothetical protein HGM15179_019229 [Zosterops borbonicus]
MFWGFMNNCTHFVRGRIGDEAFQSFLSLLSFESVTSLLGNVQCPLNVKDTTFLVFHLVSFLYMVCSLSRVRSEISRRADETPDPEVGHEVGPAVENPEWCGEWEDMGQTLKEFSDPIAWDFPCENIQNPAVVGKYLKEKCQEDSKDKRIIAISGALAYAYHTLLDTVGQQREAGGREINQQLPQSLRQQLNQIVSLRHWQSPQQRGTHKKQWMMMQVKDPQCLWTTLNQKSNKLTPNQKLIKLKQNQEPNQLAQDQEPLLSPFP